MIPSALMRITLLLSAMLTIAASVRADVSTTPARSRQAANILFDRAADLFPKDPSAARALFNQSAAQYEQLFVESHDHLTKAALAYNAGAARQLGGDTGRAVLNFRRAELLAPSIPGLAERLAAARLEAGAAAAAVPAKDARDITQYLWALARSVPPLILWILFLCCFALFWLLLLLRIAAPVESRIRPSAPVLSVTFIPCLLAAGAIGACWFRNAAAARTIVLLAPVTGRTIPDDRIGPPSGGAPLKPGRELLVLREGAGGDGSPWLLVAESDDAPSDAAPIWIPAAATARVVEREQPPPRSL